MKPRRAGIITRTAGWSIRHPWWAIGLWLAFVATTVVLGGMTETRQAGSADLGVGESGRAEEIIDATGRPEPATDLVLITPHPTWDESAAQAAADAVDARLRPLPEVAQVGEPVRSPVTDALLVPVTLTEPAEGDPDMGPVLDELAALSADHPGLRIEAAGGEAVNHAINEVVDADLASAGLLSLPVTLVILLVVFGALVAAGVPLLLSVSAVAAATGLWAYASQVVPDIGTVPQVILLIGLAVGVDYSLFYLKREREERRRGHGKVDAVRLASATSGRVVVVSGLTSVVALAGLYLAGDAIFSALGTGVILAVLVSMVGSLTVLPALLVKLGRATDRPRIPLLWRLTAGTGEPRVWRVLLAPALRAPGITLVVALVALVALAAPAVGMNLRGSTEADLSRDIPVMRAYDRLVAAFPDEGNTHRVVVQAPAADAPAVQAALSGLAAAAAADPLFTSEATPGVWTSPDGTVSIVDVAYPYEAASPEAERSLVRLRADLLPAAFAAVPAAETAVTGITADSVDYTDHQVSRLPWVIGFVLALTVGMMAFAFRSVVVALVAGGLSLLSVAAAFGVLTLVFQRTWAEELLGFTSTGHIVSWVPLFMFVVLFGLSMDYHVYVVSRIREAALTGLPTRLAVRAGLLRSAGVVTSAAVVMVAVFSIFATLSLIEMKQLGVGLAAAIAIDATLVRLVLLPSVMNLLGRANWWPSRLARGPAGTAPFGPPPGPPAGLAADLPADQSRVTAAGTAAVGQG